MTKCRERLIQRQLSGLRGQHLRAAFLGSLKSLGACPTGLHLSSACFDSTQRGHHMTWRKLVWWVWMGGGGRAIAPLCLIHVLTQRKKDSCQWGFFTNFDIFQKGFFHNILGPDASSVARGQWIRATNIKEIKNIFKHFRIANIFVQYKGIAQCFFSTKLEQHY